MPALAYVSVFLAAATVTTSIILWKGVRLEMPLPTPLELALQFRHFVVPGHPDYEPDPEELDRTIAELGGLTFLYRSLSGLRLQAKRRLAMDSSNAWSYDRVIPYIWELRLLIIPLCWIETRVTRHFPVIPRVFIWTMADMYYKLNMLLHSMMGDL